MIPTVLGDAAGPGGRLLWNSGSPCTGCPTRRPRPTRDAPGPTGPLVPRPFMLLNAAEQQRTCRTSPRVRPMLDDAALCQVTAALLATPRVLDAASTALPKASG